MADRWGVKQYPKQKSLRGKASVRITKSTVRVAFDTDPENVYEIPLENAPQILKPGKWFVSLSAKGDRMYSLSPVEGPFSLRFKEIAHSKDQPPAPGDYVSHWKSEQGKDMETSYQGFTMLFEITEGPCAGMVVASFLRYYFAASNDGFVLFDKPRSPHTKTLSDTLDAVGAFDKGPMKYSENILPALQVRIQSANYPLMGIIKEGNLDSLTRIQNYQEQEQEPEEGEDQPANTTVINNPKNTQISNFQNSTEPKKKGGKRSAKEIVDEIAPQ